MLLSTVYSSQHNWTLSCQTAISTLWMEKRVCPVGRLQVKSPADAIAIYAQEPRGQNWLCAQGGRDGILFMMASGSSSSLVGVWHVDGNWQEHIGGKWQKTHVHCHQNTNLELNLLWFSDVLTFGIWCILTCFSFHRSCKEWVFSFFLF